LMIDGRHLSPEERSRSWSARERGRSGRLGSSCEACRVESCKLFRSVRVHVTIIEKYGGDVSRTGAGIWRSRDCIEAGGEGLVGGIEMSVLLLLLADDGVKRMNPTISWKPTAWP